MQDKDNKSMETSYVSMSQVAQFIDDPNVILNKYNHLLITESTDIPAPVEVLKIKGETISTEGNITTISGPSKSGKSAFTSVLLAGAISEGEYDGFPDVEISPAKGKAVIHFDTEQAKHKHQRNLKSVLKRAGMESCTPNFLSYNLREEDLGEYCKITDEIVAAAYQMFGGIHLIVVDGPADYIKDVNEPNQSNALVKFFLDLASRYSTAIIVIVHVNPGTDKERGHFGSQLQRKSESVLTIKTQGDISCLEPKLLRGAGKGDIPLIQFAFDKEKGYHVYCGIKPIEEQSVKDYKRLEDIKGMAKTVFSPPSAFSYKVAIDNIMKHSKRRVSTAKGFFTEMKAHEFIQQGDDDLWRLNMELDLA